MRSVVTCAVVLMLAASPVAVSAQQPEAVRPSRLIISERAIAEGFRTAPPPPAVQRNDDSVANGLIIGALIGAAATAAAGGWVCHMLREPSDPPCWKSVGPSALIGAAIGAGAGAGIDALMSRQQRQFPLVERRPSR